MSDTSSAVCDFRTLLQQHLEFLYPEHDSAALLDRITELFPAPSLSPEQHDRSLWTEADCLLITYGDSLKAAGEPPLQTLKRFLTQSVGQTFSAVHILPFCPFSSDDGFSVIDYTQINPQLGDWQDLTDIADDYRLMADLVINHVSAASQWFTNYCQGADPGAGYFVEVSSPDDLSLVVRPRASPLLRPTETTHGLKHLWCTFSHDQIDLNFKNPEVLLQFLQIIRLYLQQGISILRLDAIGYLWKEPGTTCIHLPQTHEVVRLLRSVTDYYFPGTVLITETNVPNHENLSYFGNRNEAHVIYNFSLAPLLVHALLTGETGYLKRWLMSMPPAPAGCTYLNFTASHDGIGMRPAEGLLSDQEQRQMVETIQRFGGFVSTRRTSDGAEHVYELNISLFDALQGTVAGRDEFQHQRFLCSQTVMLAVEGVPAFYIHSLLATVGDHEAVTRTGQKRSVNRHQWDYLTLQQRLADPTSDQSLILTELQRRIQIRRQQAAFHPNATQFTLQLPAPFFAFWRQSTDRAQSIFAIYNMSAETQELRLSDLNLIALDQWHDLISGQRYPDLTATVSVNPYQCLWISNTAARG